jgi:hypothetical protein
MTVIRKSCIGSDVNPEFLVAVYFILIDANLISSQPIRPDERGERLLRHPIGP